MTKKTLTYTKEELDERSEDFHQLILDALERGDMEKAKYWAKRNQETRDYIHDMYLAWVPRLLSLIHERLGEDQFVPILRESVKSFIEPLYGAKKAMVERGGMR